MKSGDKYTANAADYNELQLEAQTDGFRRILNYNRAIKSLYCQYIMKITAEIDRITVKTLSVAGYKDKDFGFRAFCHFTDGLDQNLNGKRISELKNYNSYCLLHKINDFLKHNTIRSYRTLKKIFPGNVASIQNKKALCDYQNGMFAGDWIILEENYIDKVLNKLLDFFEDYCRVFFQEDLEESKWNFDEYFLAAKKKMQKF